jgi:hypothetical protein
MSILADIQRRIFLAAKRKDFRDEPRLSVPAPEYDQLFEALAKRDEIFIVPPCPPNVRGPCLYFGGAWVIRA